MRRTWILLLGFVLIALGAVGQNDLAACEEEYRRKLGDLEDTDSMRLYLGYFGCLNNANPDLARQVLLALLQKPALKASPDVYYDAKVNLGAVLVNQSEFDEALQIFNEVYLWAKANNNHYRMSLARMNAGIIHRKRSAFGSSMEAYVQSLGHARDGNHERLIATILQNMGSLANSTGQYEQAKAYLRESVMLNTKLKNERGKAGALANLGISLKSQGKTDSAVALYTEAASAFKQLNDKVNQAKMHSNIGQLHMATGAYDEAQRQLNIAIDMMEEQKNYNDLVNTLNAKSQLLSKQGLYKAAITISKRAILLAEKQGYLLGAQNAYQYLSEAQAGNDQNEEALASVKNMQRYTDSIRRQEQDSLLLEMQTRYESEKKDLEIAAKDERLSLQGEKIRYTYGIGALLVLLLLVLLFNLWRRRYYHNRLKTQHRLLEIQNEELTQLAAFKDRMLTIVSHDVRNPLAGLKSMLALQSSGAITQEEFSEWNADVTHRIDSALGMLHNLLEWSKLEYIGLKPFKERVDLQLFMREVIEQVQYQASFKSVDLKWELEPGVTVFTDRHMLRTSVYNLMSNAIKFSNKDDAVLVLGKSTPYGTSIEVIDQGVGMDAATVQRLEAPKVNFSTFGTENEKGSGVGLVLVKEMLQLMGARLEIESKVGEGSTFRIIMPE